MTNSTAAPAIAGQPFVLTCSANGDVTLPATFKWQRVLGTSWIDPPETAVSATARSVSTLSFASVGVPDGGIYRCLVTNEAGSRSSFPAEVTVHGESTIPNRIIIFAFVYVL